MKINNHFCVDPLPHERCIPIGQAMLPLMWKEPYSIKTHNKSKCTALFLPITFKKAWLVRLIFICTMYQ